MSIVWGFAASARAQVWIGYASVAVGLLLAAMGLHGLFGFLP